jgi:hypothetical protein
MTARPFLIQPATDPARIIRTVAAGARRLDAATSNLDAYSTAAEAEALAGQADGLRRELLRLAAVIRGERQPHGGPPRAA